MPENMKSLNGYGFDAAKLNGKPGSEYASAESLSQLKDDLAELETYAIGTKNDVDLLAGCEEISEFSWIENEYCETQKWPFGTVKPYSGWHRTDYIPIPLGCTTIKLFSTSSSDAQAYNAFYDKEKNYIKNFICNNKTTEYSVPQNAKYYMLSANSSVNVSMATIIVSVGSMVKKISDYKYKPTYQKKSGSLTSGEKLELDDNAIKTYSRIGFIGTISNFGSVFVGRGCDATGADYIKVDSTNLYHYAYSNVLKETIPHGLAIANNIQISISKDFTNTVIVSVVSDGSEFRTTIDSWDGSYGRITALSDGSTITDCQLVYSNINYQSDIWMFGDSYFGIGTVERWTYHLLTNGYKKVLVDGWAGRGSYDARLSLQANLKCGTPKMIIWCMGMNDPDNRGSYVGAVNISWKSRFDEVRKICEENNIELVLATIPPIPKSGYTDSNKYKNQIVRNSGYRYIDFEKAVGATASGAWFNGMLSGDEIHPTEKGARALYMQAMADVPELYGCYVIN